MLGGTIIDALLASGTLCRPGSGLAAGTVAPGQSAADATRIVVVVHPATTTASGRDDHAVVEGGASVAYIRCTAAATALTAAIVALAAAIPAGCVGLPGILTHVYMERGSLFDRQCTLGVAALAADGVVRPPPALGPPGLYLDRGTGVGDDKVLLGSGVGESLAPRFARGGADSSLAGRVPAARGPGLPGHMEAAGLGDTTVVSANLLVITVEGICSGLALTVATGIVEGAGVAVFTAGIVGREDTSIARVTTVIGADILVITDCYACADALPVHAVVERRTLVTVVALRSVVAVDAAGHRIAGVVSADILVVAVGHAGADAECATALIDQSAGITVITAQLVGSVDAAVSRVTAIICAEVAVVAVQERGSHALPLEADVPQSAGGAVVTLTGNGHEAAPDSRFTAVLGTLVAVITRHQSTAGTLPQVANINGGAKVAVIAGGTIEKMDTPRLRVTGVCCADVVVVTLRQTLVHTASRFAMVTGGAVVAIIASRLVGLVDTALIGLTGIVGAWIAIVAHRSLTANTACVGNAALRAIAGILIVANEGSPWEATVQSIATLEAVALVAIVTTQGCTCHTTGIWGATLIPVAGIAVIAIQGGASHTSYLRIAALGAIAEIAIIAHQRGTSLTASFYATIGGGADVAVIAGETVVLVLTATLWIAQIVGAGIPVVAVSLNTGQANPFVAVVANGTGAPILAKEPIIGGSEATLPGTFVAHRLQANRPQSRWERTGDNRLGVNPALIWQTPGIAIERSVAEVAIFKGLAIGGCLAIAIHCHSRTFPGTTLVRHGTGVTIITSRLVALVEAAPSLVTGVVSTRIVIIAIHRLAYADAGITVICDGTGVPIEALTFIEGHVRASRYALTRVISTGVTVITEAHILVVFEEPLVDVPVTVIIKAIAEFQGRLLSIASGEPLGAADSLTVAGAKLVGHVAGSPEGELDRRSGARADPRISNTLGGADAVDGDGSRTGEAPGAVIVVHTEAAAESSLATIVDADVIGPAHALAVGPQCARAAEIGKIRDADEDQVGVTAGNLLAGPARRTL